MLDTLSWLSSTLQLYVSTWINLDQQESVLLLHLIFSLVTTKHNSHTLGVPIWNTEQSGKLFCAP